MKKGLLLGLVIVLFMFKNTNAQSIIVKIKGIKSDKGNIMLMAEQVSDNQEGKTAKPIFSMQKASKDTISFELKVNANYDYKISVFHDENNDHKMNMDDHGRPIEGFARDIYSATKDKGSMKMKLYYPVLE